MPHRTVLALVDIRLFIDTRRRILKMVDGNVSILRKQKGGIRIMKKVLKKKNSSQTTQGFALYFQSEDLKDRNILPIIRKLIDMKLVKQRHNPVIYISPLEFEIIKNVGEFVDKEKYNNDTIVPNEIGKIKGKRLALLE
jgi:hypothetical protein